METLNYYDHVLMDLLNFNGGMILDNFWYWFSYKWTWVPLYLIIIYVLWQRKTKVSHFCMMLLTAVLIVVLCDQIASGLIKPWAARLRPSHDPLIADALHYVNGYHAGKYGFVSSHAANTCGISIFIGTLFRKRIVHALLLLWVLFTCYSRIYLGVHFPGDILGGLLVGILVGTACTIAYKKAYQRFI